jgi:outer membrane protein OmpA-like peptidoglycan-associated protein
MEPEMKKPVYTVLAAITAASLMVSSTFAEPVKYYPLSVELTPIQVAKILKGSQFKPNNKMRGIRLVGDAASSAEIVTAVQLPAPTINPESTPAELPSALAVPIPFGFNSSQLAPEATAPLDQIAEGLKLVQSSGASAVVIEGHTDGIGNQQYNLRLSQKRAAAVKRYLVKVHGIDAGSLRAIGKGKSQPLNPSDPNAEENRRVEFKLG